MPRATREAELLLKAAPDSSMVAALVANVRDGGRRSQGAFELVCRGHQALSRDGAR